MFVLVDVLCYTREWLYTYLPIHKRFSRITAEVLYPKMAQSRVFSETIMPGIQTSQQRFKFV